MSSFRLYKSLHQPLGIQQSLPNLPQSSFPRNAPAVVFPLYIISGSSNNNADRKGYAKHLRRKLIHLSAHPSPAPFIPLNIKDYITSKCLIVGSAELPLSSVGVMDAQHFSNP